MDPTKFDDLTKALATPTSRRQALKTLGATVVGGILGLNGIGTAFAKCKPDGHPCGNDRQCCSGSCVAGTCSACPVGTAFINGACIVSCTSQGLGCPLPTPASLGCSCYPTGAVGAICASSMQCLGGSGCTSNNDCAALGTGFVCIVRPQDASGCCFQGCPPA